jgi:hypothetical protein
MGWHGSIRTLIDVKAEQVRDGLNRHFASVIFGASRKR